MVCRFVNFGRSLVLYLSRSEFVFCKHFAVMLFAILEFYSLLHSSTHVLLYGQRSYSYSSIFKTFAFSVNLNWSCHDFFSYWIICFATFFFRVSFFCHKNQKAPHIRKYYIYLSVCNVFKIIVQVSAVFRYFFFCYQGWFFIWNEVD